MYDNTNSLNQKIQKKMKRQLKSLKGKKLKSTDLITIKGGSGPKGLNSSIEPVNTMVLTPMGGGHVKDDGNTDDSDWTSGSDL